jgi:hypothetical protein
MDDLDEIRALSGKHGPSCRAGVMLSAMDPAMRDMAERALAAPDIETKAVVRWLGSKGIDIGYTSLRRHQLGECRCG